MGRKKKYNLEEDEELQKLFTEYRELRQWWDAEKHNFEAKKVKKVKK